MRRRITSLFLVLTLCLTLLPTAALAEELQNEVPSTPQEETTVVDSADEESPDNPEPAPEEDSNTGESSDEEQADEPEPETEEGEPDQPSVQADTETGAAKTDEIYEISNADDLEAFCKRVNSGESSLNAVLVKDVSRSKNYSWTSIKGYTGVFDGNGHTITLRVGVKGENSALFGSIASGGTVQDLTIYNLYWNGNSSESGAIAYSNAGTIQRCQALDWTGEKNIGGIVYQNEKTGVVKDCRVGTLTLSKSRENLVGGIAFVNNGLIQNCYVSGRLQSTYNGTRGDLSSSTAIVRTNSGTVENCYYFQYDSETAVAGTPVANEAMFASGEVAYKLNGEKTELDSVWRQNLPDNKDSVDADTLPVTDASHGRVYYDSETNSYYSLVPHLHGADEMTAWQQTDSLPSDSGSYYLTEDVTLDAGQKMDKDVTLCLNGHNVIGDVTVTGSFTLTDCGSGSVTGDVTVNEGSSFTLEDCALFGRIENNGTLTISGGTVTANEGIAVTNHGTFTISSGTITASGSTGVDNSGTLIMSGGTVTGCDKGVENKGTMEVSGKVKIAGNTNGNLILPDGKTVTVGTLDSTANIGITAEKQSDLTAESLICLTNGGAAYLARFFADDAESYGISVDGDDLVMRLRSEHTHCICGHPADSAGNVGDHTEHTDVTFLPWISGNTLPTEGNYYLTQNVVLDKMTVLTGTLCLNGYSITAKDGGCPVEVSSAVMNLTDCAAQPGSVTAAKDQAILVYSTANIFNGVIQGGSGAGILIKAYSANANVAIYGGKITGSSTGTAANNGTIHMYGGEISGNSRGVQAGGKKENGEFNGSFYLHGGKITDNHGSEGGGVYVMKNFYMDGGEVSNNTATGNGGGIYMSAGYFAMSGGKVTGNRAGGNGGGVCTKAFRNDRSVVDLSGSAEISNNYAGGLGGGVYLDVFYWDNSPNDYSNYCRLTMNGGKIIGNTSVGDGGGVYADARNGNWRTKSVVMVKGNPQITGNKKGEEDNNLYLPGPSEGVTINGDLDETADIRVTTENKPGEGSDMTIAKRGGLGTPNTVTVPDGVFKTDGGGSISVDADGTVKLLPCAHSWTYTASGAVITAKCGICSASGGSVTIAAPAELTYNGSGKAAVVTASNDWQGPAVNGITVSYTKTGTYGPEKLENGALPTGADTYTASITVKNADASVEDATASVAYTITPATLTITDAEVENKTYDGTPDATVTAVTFDGLVEGDSLTLGTDFTATGVFKSANASYNTQPVTVTVSLADSVKNYTLGKSTFVKQYCMIEKALLDDIDVPLAIRNGVIKTYEVELPDLPELEAPKSYGSSTPSYSLDQTSFTDDDYTVTAELDANTAPKVLKLNVTAAGGHGDFHFPEFAVRVATDNYYDIKICVKVTAKDKTVPTGEPTLTPDHITYGDTLSSITLSGALKDRDTDVPGTFTWADGSIKPDAGYYEAEWKFVPTDGDNYAPATGKAFITIDRKSIADAVITLENDSLVYNGNEQSAAVNSVSIGGNELGTGDYTVEVGGQTNAGTYYLTIKGIGNYTDEKAVQWNILQKTVTDPAVTLEYTTHVYTGEELRPTVTVKDGETVIPASEYTVSYESNTNAGTATVTVTNKTGGNYQIAEVSTNFSITKADASIAAAPKANTLTYNGTEQPLVTAGTAVGGTMQYGTGAALGDRIPTATDADTYTVYYIVKGDANHNDSDQLSVTVTIARAAVTVTAENKTSRIGQELRPLTYDCEPELFAGDSFTGELATEADKNTAGETAITQGTLALNDNYILTFVPGTYTVAAKQAQSGFAFAESEMAKTYGDADFTVAAVGAAKDSTVTYTSSDTSVATVDDHGTVHIMGAGQTVITAKAAETADDLESTANYTLTVARKSITPPAADDTVYTYNGAIQTYQLAAGEGYAILGSLAETNANEAGYAITVSLTDKANTQWADTEDATDKTYSFVIHRAPVTVTAKDKTAYVGGTAPILPAEPVKDTDYTVSEMYGADTLEGTVTLTYDSTPDMTKAGTTTIKISGTLANDNYTVTYADGKLTISARPSSGGGGGGSTTYPVNTPNKTENGTVTVSPKNASKGSTVTITVKPDSGYQLDDLTITDKDGNELKLTNKGNGQYTFTMPAGKVEISATFAKKVEVSPFNDVSTDAYYYEAVKWAQEKGITGGIGNGLFGPNQPCTRAQIVTFLWRAAGSPESKNASSFADVPAGSYYAKAVAWAVENGITTGTGDGKFSPDNPCTRAQSVTFLYRALGKLAGRKTVFSDVPADSYYADAVAWAVENGVTNGTSETTFGPADSCTRAQIVTFLYRAYQGK